MIEINPYKTTSSAFDQHALCILVFRRKIATQKIMIFADTRSLLAHEGENDLCRYMISTCTHEGENE